MKQAKEATDNELILYTDSDGKTTVNVRFAEEDVWVTQAQLAQIYETTPQNITMHIKNIYDDGELPKEATCKDFLQVQTEGSRQVKRNTTHYNLDIIIAIGYRVQSKVATRFRTWATGRLHEYIQKGFSLDDERLKQGRNRYFKELLQRIRDIRSSERNFYQQVTDIYATATDYDPRSKMTLQFFATVQNKLHYAVHEHTAAELIYVTKDDAQAAFSGDLNNFHSCKRRGATYVKIAKNYLSEIELKRLNLLVSEFLDFAEFQALEEKPMTMQNWIETLDNQIIAHKRKILEGNGKITHEQAIEKAEKEYDLFRQKELANHKSDFDIFLEQVKKIEN